MGAKLMKQDVKISIIIPVYNAEKYINKCIESILKQTYSNIEIVIIDDGSKDSSKEIIEEMCKKEKKIKFISRENKGVLKTRNEAIGISTGDYIMFVDADDYIQKDMIQNMIKCNLEKEYDVIRCGLIKVNNEGKIIEKIPVTDKIEREDDLHKDHPHLFSSQPESRGRDSS